MRSSSPFRSARSSDEDSGVLENSIRSTPGNRLPRIGCVGCAARDTGVSRSSQSSERKARFRREREALAGDERCHHEGAGAQGPLAVRFALRFDRLAREAGKDGRREQKREDRFRRIEPNAQRMAIHDDQPRHRRIVVEARAGVLGAFR